MAAMQSTGTVQYIETVISGAETQYKDSQDQIRSDQSQPEPLGRLCKKGTPWLHRVLTACRTGSKIREYNFTHLPCTYVCVRINPRIQIPSDHDCKRSVLLYDHRTNPLVSCRQQYLAHLPLPLLSPCSPDTVGSFDSSRGQWLGWCNIAALGIVSLLEIPGSARRGAFRSVLFFFPHPSHERNVGG